MCIPVHRCERFNNKRKLNFVLLDTDKFSSRNATASHRDHKRRCFYSPQIFGFRAGMLVETKKKGNFMFAQAELPRDENKNVKSGNSRWLKIFPPRQNIFYYVQNIFHSRWLLGHIIRWRWSAHVKDGEIT